MIDIIIMLIIFNKYKTLLFSAVGVFVFDVCLVEVVNIVAFVEAGVCVFAVVNDIIVVVNFESVSFPVFVIFIFIVVNVVVVVDNAVFSVFVITKQFLFNFD